MVTEALAQPHVPAIALDEMCILINDATNRRLVEGVAAQLGLNPRTVTVDELIRASGSNGAAMIVVEEDVASDLRHLAVFTAGDSDLVPPALVAVLPVGSSEMPLLPKRVGELPYDGILVLPQTPAILLAQLSVILYAHRAYVQRFESAMEELQLNRRIFRSVTSGISVASATSDDFPLIYVNPAFEVMTGYSLEDVEGKNCRFLQGNEPDQPGLTLIREALTGRRETVAVIRNYRKDGSPFWNELSLSPIIDREGKLTHFVGIQNDVTARVAFEEALRDSEKLAAMGRLAASIAHEINNPLATVTNLIYLARHEDAQEQRTHFLDVAAEELTRVTLLTTQSLRFYRQSTRPTVVRPVDLVAAVLDVYSVRMANLAITLERMDSTCESIVCLESEIRQVLSNLLRNAIDALEGRPGRVLVRVRESTNWRNNTKGVRITLADTGHGMTPQTKERLYTAFHTTKGQSGTGLGLWVSKEIVDRHHGTLAVRSRQTPPGCTIFTLFLPYQSLLP